MQAFKKIFFITHKASNPVVENLGVGVVGMMSFNLFPLSLVGGGGGEEGVMVVQFIDSL